MAVVVYPANLAVPADNAVLHIVHALVALFYLLIDGAGDCFIVIGVYHALEGIARQFLEFRKVLAAEDFKDCLVGIEDLFGLLSLVDEEAPGHVPPDFLHHLESLAAQLIVAVEHG